jgi:hypothetical protein
MAEEEQIGLSTDELPRAKDAIAYIADKRLIARLERQERQASRLVREPSLPTWAGELPYHLDERDWNTGFLDVHDYNILPELISETHQNAPQALLRDLYRPQRDFYWPEWELMVRLDRGGAEAHKDALAAQKREAIEYIPPLLPEMTQQAREWRQVVDERWKPFLDDSEPRKSVGVMHEPSLAW